MTYNIPLGNLAQVESPAGPPTPFNEGQQAPLGLNKQLQASRLTQ